MSLPIREATEADLVFVVKSWIDSYKTAHTAGPVAIEDWPTVMPPVFRKILAREGVTVLVAYHDKATTTKADIMGWLAYERGFSVPTKFKVRGRQVTKMQTSDRPLIHYFYTKQHYRRLTVWSQLMQHAGIDFDEPMYLSCKTGTLPKLPLTRAEFEPLIAKHPKEKR